MNPVQFYKCLADDTRLRCLLLIHEEEELCVCELMEALGESQPKISRHLAQLRQCGLLVDRRQGQWVFYRFNPTLSKWINKVLAETAHSNGQYLEKSRQQLAKMGERPSSTASCC